MNMLKFLVFAQVTLLMMNSYGQDKLEFKNLPKAAGLFAEGFVSTPMYERDMAISPDGTEMLYTTMVPFSNFQTIMYSKKSGSKWSQPEVVSFCGKYSDLEPAFSSDGKRLYFSSNRPLDGDKAKDFDIWYVEKVNGSWSEPKNLGSPINTSADEFYPSLASNGNIYFTAQYKNGIGREDIYVARYENGSYLQPVVLDTMVNSSFFEFNAFVSPDEKFIIYSSQGRKDEKGRGDLYISVKDENNNWKKAQNLAILNSDRLDYCPFVSFDQKILFFSSEKHDLKRSFKEPVNYQTLKQSVSQPLNGLGNIYWIDFQSLKQYFQ